jgi:hypothetical protein
MDETIPDLALEARVAAKAKAGGFPHPADVERLRSPAAPLPTESRVALEHLELGRVWCCWWWHLLLTLMSGDRNWELEHPLEEDGIGELVAKESTYPGGGLGVFCQQGLPPRTKP